jgi:hypothetical protein
VIVKTVIKIFYGERESLRYKMFYHHGHYIGSHMPEISVALIVTPLNKEVEEYSPIQVMAQRVGHPVAYPIAEVDKVLSCFAEVPLIPSHPTEEPLFVVATNPLHVFCINPCTLYSSLILGITGFVLTISGKVSLSVGLSMMGIAVCLIGGAIYVDYKINQYIRENISVETRVEVDVEAQLIHPVPTSKDMDR